jgi:tetratricopeptide (TPR) repeat protein
MENRAQTWSREDWRGETRRWTTQYAQDLQRRLEQTIQRIADQHGNLSGLQEHLGSMLTMLRQARIYPSLHGLATKLIVSLHPWPEYWGCVEVWESELQFGAQVAYHLGWAALQAEINTYLAEILLSSWKNNAALDVGRAAILETHQTDQAVLLARAGLVVVVTLDKTGQTTQSEAALANLEALLVDPEWAVPEQDRQMALAHINIHKVDLLRRVPQLDAALALACQTIAHLEKIPEVNRNLLADAFGIRGLIYWNRHDWQASSQDYEHQISLLATEGYLLGQASALANLGLLYWKMCRFDLAEQAQRRSIEIREHLNAHKSLTRVIGDLGLVCFSRGQLYDAIHYFKHQLSLASAEQNQMVLNMAQNNLAAVQTYAGQSAEARHTLEAVLVSFRRQKREELVISALLDLTICCWNLHKIVRARRLVEQAWQIVQNPHKDFGFLKCVVLRCLAVVQPSEQAEDTLRQALFLASQYKRSYDEAACRLSLAGVVADPTESELFWAQGVQMLEEMGATAWLDGHSARNPPFLPIFA